MNGFDLFCGILIFLIIGCGTFGNVLSFMVWTTGRRCKKLPGGIYLRALAVSDTIALFIPAFNEAITLVSPLNTKEENDFLCKLESVGRHYGLMVSSWIIVTFTLERTVAIFRPAATTKLVSKNGTIALMSIIFVVSLLMNVPYGIVYGIKQEAVTKPFVFNNSHPLESNLSERLRTNSTLLFETPIVGYSVKCSADKASLFHFENWYHIWLMDVFLIFIIPFTLMTGSNVIVVYLLFSRKSSMISKLDSKIKSVTMRAVTISVMHCITSGSFTMSTLFPDFLNKAVNVKYSNEYYGYLITLLLAYINHAMNFIIYSFFGTDFRRDCADLFLKKPSAVHPGCSTQPQKNTIGNDKRTENDLLHVNTRPELKTGKTTVSTVSTF